MVGPPPLLTAEAAGRFLRRDRFEPTTRAAYAVTLDALAAAVGSDASVEGVSTETIEGLLTNRWGTAAATTYNRHRAALGSFWRFAVERGWAHRNVVACESRACRRNRRVARAASHASVPRAWTGPRRRLSGRHAGPAS